MLYEHFTNNVSEVGNYSRDSTDFQSYFCNKFNVDSLQQIFNPNLIYCTVSGRTELDERPSSM